MTARPDLNLSRREQQVLDILFARGRATAADVMAALPDPPGYPAVRAMLRILEDKGHVRHEQDGSRHVYAPTVAGESARKFAIRHVVKPCRSS